MIDAFLICVVAPIILFAIPAAFVIVAIESEDDDTNNQERT